MFPRFKTQNPESPSRPIFDKINRIMAGPDGSYAKFNGLNQHLDDEGRTNLGTMLLQSPGMALFKDTDMNMWMKSLDLSVRFRNSGNKQFMKDNEEAVSLYSKCIAAAPYPSTDKDSSKELALGFANRSAAYFALKKYDACLRDIGHALTFEYPGELKYKLLERRAKCYQIMGKKEEALASAQEAKDSLPAAIHLSEDNMASIIAALNNLQLTPGSFQCELPSPPDALKPLPKMAFNQHPNIPSAADCMEVKYNKKFGRHIVATRDIDPGDAILIESPYALVLCSGWYPTHCFNCTKRTDAMIPCKICNYAMFCSNECLTYAWDTYHKVQYKLVPALKELDVGSQTLLPLRLFLTTCSKNQGLEGLHRLVKELEAQKSSGNIKGFDQNGKYSSTDYRQIHYLVQNKNLQPKEQLRHVVIAGCIFNALDKYSDFFYSTNTNRGQFGTSKVAKQFAMGLIIKLVDVGRVNSIAIEEMLIGNDYLDAEFRGTGVYSTLSLLAHSCDANA